MAKLSAGGRFKLAQVTREKTMPATQPCRDCNATGAYADGTMCLRCKGSKESKPLTTWERRPGDGTKALVLG